MNYIMPYQNNAVSNLEILNGLKLEFYNPNDIISIESIIITESVIITIPMILYQTHRFNSRTLCELFFKILN